MPSSVWSGFISFGLISVPVRLYTAARYSHLAFHEIHRKCGTRVRQQLYCPHDEEVVSRDEIAMGYEISKDKYVLVDTTELKQLHSASSKTMEILQFVRISEVDPIYYEKSYFSVPEEAGARAYTLLLRTMEQMQYAAIAKVILHQRERTVILRPYQGGLALHTIYYPSEIHAVKGYGKDAPAGLKKQEITLAEQFAKGLLKPFEPDQYKDEYQARVKHLIESHAKGQPLPKPEKAKRIAPVIDLMSALKNSLAAKSRPTAASKGKRLKKTA
jgi:DNA end-binding protein Ku